MQWQQEQETREHLEGLIKGVRELLHTLWEQKGDMALIREYERQYVRYRDRLYALTAPDRIAQNEVRQ